MVVELDDHLVGALLATIDVPPVAWVRMAAISERLWAFEWISELLHALQPHLTEAGARTLAWMGSQGWARSALQRRGFETAARVITLSKSDRSVPQVGAPEATLRPAIDADYGPMASIDRQAFDPLWWRSEESVRQRAATTSRFLVAELTGQVIGYAEREQHAHQGHLNRLVVEPNQQNVGIGGLLLRATLEHLWAAGSKVVSLNTQASNPASRGLYKRFGFRPTGAAATVWTLPLNATL